MKEAVQAFVDRGPYPWLPVFMLAVWATWLVPDGAATRRPVLLPTARRWDAANVVDLEAYRQRRRMNHGGWNAARPSDRLKFPRL